MTKILTAENAQITTATIAVKTITVEKRQITLSIFRQVIEEDIVDREVLRLRGVGWGHCRYLIEATPDKAIHLVWQKGGELRRCVVKRYADRWTADFRRELNKLRIVTRTEQSDTGAYNTFLCTSNDYWPWKIEPLDRWYVPPADELELEEPVKPEPPVHMKNKWGFPTEEFRQTPIYLSYKTRYDAWFEACNAHRKRLSAHKEVAMADYKREVEEKLQQEYDDRCAWCDQYEALVAPLFGLPQLFIAA
jgi:hypothetical protein